MSPARTQSTDGARVAVQQVDHRVALAPVGEGVVSGRQVDVRGAGRHVQLRRPDRHLVDPGAAGDVPADVAEGRADGRHIADVDVGGGRAEEHEEHHQQDCGAGPAQHRAGQPAAGPAPAVPPPDRAGRHGDEQQPQQHRQPRALQVAGGVQAAVPVRRQRDAAGAAVAGRRAGARVGDRVVGVALVEVPLEPVDQQQHGRDDGQPERDQRAGTATRRPERRTLRLAGLRGGPGHGWPPAIGTGGLSTGAGPAASPAAGTSGPLRWCRIQM